MKKSKFHGTQVSPNYNPLSITSVSNAWRKVAKSGRFKDWMDYEKWELGQVNPIYIYKRGI